MMRKWRDWFTDVCDVCEKALTIDGLVYVIRDKQGICAECYESIKIYLIDEEIMPLPDKYRSITSDNADYFEQGEEE